MTIDTKRAKMLLNAFTMLVQSDVDKMTDAEALGELNRYLKLKNPFILMTKDGPMFNSLIRKFKLDKSTTVEDSCLGFPDDLNPELVLETSMLWNKLKITVEQLDNARSLFYLY